MDKASVYNLIITHLYHALVNLSDKSELYARLHIERAISEIRGLQRKEEKGKIKQGDLQG